MSTFADMARRSGSRSTDKLMGLMELADRALNRDPNVAQRITSVELSWVEKGGELLPEVKMQFKE